MEQNLSIKLKKEYTIAWLILISVMAINEFFIDNSLQDLIWDILFVLVMIVEGFSLYRKAKGDSLSEHVWAFQTGPARSLLVAGFTVWMCINFAHLGSGQIDISRIILSIGLCLWLLIHWIFKGKYG